jgi:hypothetical protein
MRDEETKLPTTAVNDNDNSERDGDLLQDNNEHEVNTSTVEDSTNAVNKNDKTNIHDDERLTIREQMISVQASNEHSGVIEVSKKQYYIAQDTEMLISRPSFNAMFVSMFSSSIAKLYWYRPYFGILNRNQSICCNCMMECGNILVMIMETRCSNPHYHPVIYYTNTKECVIVNKPSKWPLSNFVLCPDKELTVEIEEIEK